MVAVSEDRPGGTPVDANRENSGIRKLESAAAPEDRPSTSANWGSVFTATRRADAARAKADPSTTHILLEYLKPNDEVSIRAALTQYVSRSYRDMAELGGDIRAVRRVAMHWAKRQFDESGFGKQYRDEAKLLNEYLGEVLREYLALVPPKSKEALGVFLRLGAARGQRELRQLPHAHEVPPDQNEYDWHISMTIFGDGALAFRSDAIREPDRLAEYMQRFNRAKYCLHRIAEGCSPRVGRFDFNQATELAWLAKESSEIFDFQRAKPLEAFTPMLVRRHRNPIRQEVDEEGREKNVALPTIPYTTAGFDAAPATEDLRIGMLALRLQHAGSISGAQRSRYSERTLAISDRAS